MCNDKSILFKCDLESNEVQIALNLNSISAIPYELISSAFSSSACISSALFHQVAGHHNGKF